jgi:hypothetical protein
LDLTKRKPQKKKKENYTMISSIIMFSMKYYKIHYIKEYEISGACSTHGDEKHIDPTKFWSVNLKRTDHRLGQGSANRDKLPQVG